MEIIVQYDLPDFQSASQNVCLSLFKIEDKAPKMSLLKFLCIFFENREIGQALIMILLELMLSFIKWVTACFRDILKMLWALTRMSGPDSCTLSEFSGPVPDFTGGFTQQSDS